MDAVLVASAYVSVGQGTPSYVGDSATAVSSSPSNGAPVANTAVNPATPSSGQITQAVSKINNAFNQGGQNISASFEYDKAAGVEVVTFTDQNTNNAIIQIPPKAILGIAEAIQQSLRKAGLLINTQA